MPVLSVQICEVLPSVSTDASRLTMAPRLASRPVPMARVNATTAGRPSGMAATASDTALTNSALNSCSRISPRTKTRTMTPPAMIARVRLRVSIWRCSGVGPGLALCSMSAIRPVSVSMPVAVTSTSPRPRVTAVFMNTVVARSPSAASAATSADADFSDGCASPVSIDSWISSEVADSSRPSAGIRSPASTATTSPGTSSPASMACDSSVAAHRCPHDAHLP